MVSGTQAVLAGLAPDGGLYLPEQLPILGYRDLMDCDTLTIAQRILSAFLPEIPNMRELVQYSYVGKFRSEDLTPTVAAGAYHVLELFHGPTSAFKDVALCMLPRLMTASRDLLGQQENILILTATSGDTGKAALEGFRDVPGVGICVFYPHGGVSDVQRQQMVTQEGNNVRVCAIRGNFDDAQTGVKNIFAACPDQGLSSANSINIGRLLPQITYYFTAYRDLVKKGVIVLGDEVNFSVPTGNFGNILAGFLAKQLGLPIGMLICASNANNVLTDFIRTGTYDRRRPLHKTHSPSMDILVSSNLERLLYLLSNDASLVAGLMRELDKSGHYTVPQELLQKIQRQFWAGCCDDAGAADTIGRVWAENRYLCDPHTACGWAVAEDYQNVTGDQRPMVVLSTASPYKFPAAVLSAIGGDTFGDEFSQMELLQAITGVSIPKNLSGLRAKPERHTDVIDKDQMMNYILD
jgi:threonine synthase